MRRLLALILIFAALPSAAYALAPLPGWELQASEAGLSMVSPPDQSQYRIAYVITVPQETGGEPVEWFAGVMQEALADDAAIIGRSGLVRHERMMFETLRFRRNDGVNIDVLLVAYPAKRGHQLFFAMYPSAIPQSDGRVGAVLNHIAEAYRTRFELASPTEFIAARPEAPPDTTVETASKAQPKPPAQPANPPSQAGANCRREPVWGFRISAFCQPTGICPDRVIKEYRTVCD